MSETLTMSVPEAGKLLGIGTSTAFRLAKDGTIPTLRLGRKIRVPKTALDKMLANAGNQTAVAGGG